MTESFQHDSNVSLTIELMKGKYNFAKYYLTICFRLRIIINSFWRYLRYIYVLQPICQLRSNITFSIQTEWFTEALRIGSYESFGRTDSEEHESDITFSLRLESDLSGISPYIHPDCLNSQVCQVWFIRTAKLKPCQHHLLSSMKREVAWLLMTFGGKSLRIEHTVDIHVFFRLIFGTLYILEGTTDRSVLWIRYR